MNQLNTLTKLDFSSSQYILILRYSPDNSCGHCCVCSGQNANNQQLIHFQGLLELTKSVKLDFLTNYCNFLSKIRIVVVTVVEPPAAMHMCLRRINNSITVCES